MRNKMNLHEKSRVASACKKMAQHHDHEAALLGRGISAVICGVVEGSQWDILDWSARISAHNKAAEYYRDKQHKFGL